MDLHFLRRDRTGIQELITYAKSIFHGAFNAKLFLEQLCYFDDLDMTETVEFAHDVVPDETIKSFLTQQALSV